MTREEKNAKTIVALRNLCDEAEKMYKQLFDMEEVIKNRANEIECLVDDMEFEFDYETEENSEQEQEYMDITSDIGYFTRNIMSRFRW